jgi:hypothetical protein
VPNDRRHNHRRARKALLGSLGILALALVPSSAGAATFTCSAPVNTSTYRVKATRMTCADARRFIRTWSQSCRGGQSQGNMKNCVLGLPRRPRVRLNCDGKPAFGMFAEKCYSRDHKYRLTFDADL